MPPTQYALSHLPLDTIRTVDPTNGRAELRHDDIAALAADILAHGLLHPITVRKVGTGYHLIAGNHRLAAYRHLQRPTIPAHIVLANTDDAAILRLSENLVRSQLSPIEEAYQVAEAVEAHPNAVEGIATLLNRSVTWVLNRLELTAWSDNLKDHVHAGRIKIGAARALARIPDPDIQDMYVNTAAQHGASTRTALDWLRDATSGSMLPPKNDNFSGSHDIQKVTVAFAVTCALCAKQKELNQTHSLRVCGPCIQHLHELTNQHDSDPALRENPPHQDVDLFEIKPNTTRPPSIPID